MAIYISKNNKVTDIFVNVDGEKRKIKSVWVNREDTPTRVFGTLNNDDSYELAPVEAYMNWNYTLDDTNNIITLNYYKGNETAVIVYGNYVINGKTYKTQISSYPDNVPATTKYMFMSCSGIVSIIFSRTIDTSNVTNMTRMFMNCYKLAILDITAFNTSNVTNMFYMFACCGLENLDLSHFDTSNVKNMSSMFMNSSALKRINLGGVFNTSNVTEMESMFSTTSLTSLDLSNFNTANVTKMNRMFYNSLSLETIYVTTGKWIVSQADTTNMFQRCGTSAVTYK